MYVHRFPPHPARCHICTARPPQRQQKNKPQHKCHTTNHTARRRDFENWNIQFWWYMLLRYKRRSPQNRSNNRRPGNYGNDWVENPLRQPQNKCMLFIFHPSRSMWHIWDSCNVWVWGEIIDSGLSPLWGCFMLIIGS